MGRWGERERHVGCLATTKEDVSDGPSEEVL